VLLYISQHSLLGPARNLVQFPNLHMQTSLLWAGH
jgi:hypothetical protein